MTCLLRNKMSSSFVGSLSSIWLLFRESQVSHPSSAAVKLTSLSYQYWFLCVPTCCIFAINMFAFCTLALSAWGCKFFKSLGENLCLNHSCFSSTPAIGSTTCRRIIALQYCYDFCHTHLFLKCEVYRRCLSFSAGNLQVYTSSQEWF